MLVTGTDSVNCRGAPGRDRGHVSSSYDGEHAAPGRGWPTHGGSRAGYLCERLPARRGRGTVRDSGSRHRSVEGTGVARLIPSDLSRIALAGAHAPELATLAMLQKALPDDYTVFHGVHWTREHAGWTQFGEIDFVVLNRAGAVLLVEQKNGVLEEDSGRLVKRYAGGEKDPVRQVHRSLDKVREKYRWRHPRAGPLEADYLVYLPEHRVKDLNAVGLDASRVVDARERESLAIRIQECLPRGVYPSDGRYERVHDFFCQTFEVVPDIHAHRAAHERTFVRQAGPVAALLAGLEMTPYRLRFSGTAGSGKSLLALQFFARERAAGRRVLLTCFNRPLAERLKARVGAGGVVDTFHGFCVAFLKRCGQSPDFADPELWRRIPELVTAEVVPEAERFDALVVDEGQDFEAEWLEVLRLFLTDNADLLWLEDADQNLQGRPPVPLPGFVGYRCPTNYRSPESIARFVRNTLPFVFEPGNDLPGLGVGVHRYADPAEQPKVVARVVQDLVRQGFRHDDIVLLTCRGAQGSLFSAIDAVGGLRLRRYTGEYDTDGNQVLTAGQLTFESVYRFKGQEAPAVVLVDVDPRSERREREERLLYCAMTRATVRLDLVVRQDNAANRRFLEA